MIKAVIVPKIMQQDGVVWRQVLPVPHNEQQFRSGTYYVRRTTSGVTTETGKAKR